MLSYVGTVVLCKGSVLGCTHVFLTALEAHTSPILVHALHIAITNLFAVPQDAKVAMHTDSLS